MTARVDTWLAEPPSIELDRLIRRASEIEGVIRVAVMPDAHVAQEVCVGAVIATGELLIPAAVGNDIGCGMLAIGFDRTASEIDATAAAKILSRMSDAIPRDRHRSKDAPPLPSALDGVLSTPGLEAMKRREARIELGTLGRGNHFLELQRDPEDRLWLMLHSGSRAVGPAIRKHHGSRLRADSDEGRAYLSDVAWAITFAQQNRRRMLDRTVDLLAEVIGACADESTLIECDHNHVRCEVHGGRSFWVHRKGALGIASGELGVVPGSMGSSSFHVEGRGCEESLCSCSHGAGRELSRGEARRRISARQFDREMRSVWFDQRIADQLRGEAPSAYKEIGSVMRAQRDLVRIVRRLEPVLVYKGGG